MFFILFYILKSLQMYM